MPDILSELHILGLQALHSAIHCRQSATRRVHSVKKTLHDGIRIGHRSHKSEKIDTTLLAQRVAFVQILELKLSLLEMWRDQHGFVLTWLHVCHVRLKLRLEVAQLANDSVQTDLEILFKFKFSNSSNLTKNFRILRAFVWDRSVSSSWAHRRLTSHKNRTRPARFWSFLYFQSIYKFSKKLLWAAVNRNCLQSNDDDEKPAIIISLYKYRKAKIFWRKIYNNMKKWKLCIIYFCYK